MKKLFIACLFVLIFAVVLVALIKQEPGYVLISYGLYTIESSLVVAAIVFLSLCLFLTLCFFISFKTLQKGLRLNHWFATRSVRQGRIKTAQGIIAFIEGRYAQSRRVLSSSAEKSATPLINYLFAARSSNALRDVVKTRQLLQKAADSNMGSGIAVDIIQAEMQIECGYLERSLATLSRLKHKANKYPYIYKLLQQVYIGLHDWDGLAAILPALRKSNVVTKEQLESLALRCCCERLKSLLVADGGEENRTVIINLWSKQSKIVKNNSEAVLYFARCLMSAGDQAAAEKVLRIQLNREWTAPLVDLYGVVKGADKVKQLLHAENWLKQRNSDSSLLLCLGRLSLQNELWGKAREYFEASSKLSASSEACAELARLLAGLGNHQLSNEYFRRGLLNDTRGLPELPQPGS